MRRTVFFLPRLPHYFPLYLLLIFSLTLPVLGLFAKGACGGRSFRRLPGMRRTASGLLTVRRHPAEGHVAAQNDGAHRLPVPKVGDVGDLANGWSPERLARMHTPQSGYSCPPFLL